MNCWIAFAIILGVFILMAIVTRWVVNGMHELAKLDSEREDS